MTFINQNKEALTLIKNRYVENFKGFFYEHRFFIVLLIMVGYVDVVSTIYFMEKTSPLNEIHPLIRYLAINYGIVLGTVIGKLIQIFVGLLAVIYFRKISKFLITFTAVMYGIAAMSNFIIF